MQQSASYSERRTEPKWEILRSVHHEKQGWFNACNSKPRNQRVKLWKTNRNENKKKKKKKKKRKKKSSSPKRLERMKVIQFDRFFWTCLVGEQWVVFTRHWARAGGFMSFFFSFFFFLFCLFPWLLLFFWWHSAAVRGEYRSVIMQIVGESEQDQRRSTLGELTVFRHSFAYGHCRFIERSCKRWVWHPRIQHPTSRIQHPASAAFVC